MAARPGFGAELAVPGVRRPGSANPASLAAGIVSTRESSIDLAVSRSVSTSSVRAEIAAPSVSVTASVASVVLPPREPTTSMREVLRSSTTRLPGPDASTGADGSSSPIQNVVVVRPVVTSTRSSSLVLSSIVLASTVRSRPSRPSRVRCASPPDLPRIIAPVRRP